MKIRYQANPQKLLEALIWIAQKRPESGYHFILKTLFYADKLHLQQYGRPVTGDVYIKMANGPVASLAYDMLKCSDFLPEEVAKAVREGLTVEKSGHPHVTAAREADTDHFSGTDIECLTKALDMCADKGFGALSDLTHKEKAWIEAEMNREMDFRNFIDEDLPNREELLAYIQESAACLAL